MLADRYSRYRNIFGVIFLGNRPLFPISWLHKQDYCEYQIFLENVKGLKVKPTREMTEGQKAHDVLYQRFAEKAQPTTLEQMLRQSETVKVMSREMKVLDAEHGIYGLIDEVLMGPKEFVVIDDKPGTKAFPSSIHQVYGYSLAFKQTTVQSKERKIVAALRERGTDNIYWTSPFNEGAENEVMEIINRIHGLLSREIGFGSTSNHNKCKSCRFNQNCDRLVS